MLYSLPSWIFRFTWLQNDLRSAGIFTGTHSISIRNYQQNNLSRNKNERIPLKQLLNHLIIHLIIYIYMYIYRLELPPPSKSHPFLGSGYDVFISPNPCFFQSVGSKMHWLEEAVLKAHETLEPCEQQKNKATALVVSMESWWWKIGILKMVYFNNPSIIG